MNKNPHSYFITIRTYGTRLHGQTNITVDKDHNEFGLAFAQKNLNRFNKNKNMLSSPPFYLNQSQRVIVLNSIIKTALIKDWYLHAAHVRTNHVHIVISGTVILPRFSGHISKLPFLPQNSRG